MNIIGGYIYLILAIIFGVLSSGYLKTTDNFTNLMPTIFCILTIISCIYCLNFDPYDFIIITKKYIKI